MARLRCFPASAAEAISFRGDWLWKTIDPLSRTNVLDYDAGGRKTGVTDPLGHRTQSDYDADDHLTMVTSPLPSPVQRTTYEYNARGERTNLVDAATHAIHYAYDDNGNLLRTTNRNSGVFSSTYYDDNRLWVSQTPLLKTTTRTYEQRGLLKRVVDPMHTSDMTYDDRGRMDTRSDPVGAATLVYDRNNNLLSRTENSRSIVRQYDELNRMTNYVDEAGNLIGYQYDNNGNLTRLTYPGGRPVRYAYDSNNRLTTVTDWANRATSYTYDLAGRVTRISRPNGTVREAIYDDAGRTTEIHELGPRGTAVAYFKLNYDEAGRCTNEFIAPLPLSFTEVTQDIHYDDDNRISTFNGNGVGYDFNGNMTNGPLNSSSMILHTYDARNRLTTVGASGSAPALGYGYDSEGNRTSIAQAGQTTSFVVNPNGLSQVLTRSESDGTVTYYVYGLGLLYQEDSNGNTVTYHYDLRGSTVALTDVFGRVTDRVEYSVYGRITRRTGSTDTPFLYNGRYGVMSDANGLYYMRARYYNPYIRRFLNADPAGMAGGMNWYAYANGDPICLLDPFGLGAVGEGGGSYWVDVGQVWRGYGDAAGGTVSGLWNSVIHPFDTLEGIANAITHPFQTGRAIWNGIGNTFDNLTGDDPRAAGHAMGDILLTATTFAAPYARAGTVAAEARATRILCFPAATLVLMADGSTKAIEEIKVGDKVLADEPEQSLYGNSRPVSQTHTNWTLRLVHIAVYVDGDGLSDGEFRSTSEHPIWTQNRGWINARDLVSGDKLLDAGGNEPLVRSTTQENTTCVTYNLTIESAHTFFVLAGETPVLVHNTTPGNRLYIVYQAPTADGKIYTGKASLAAEFGTVTPRDVLKYRFEGGHHRGIDFNQAQIREAIWGGGAGSDAYASIRGAEELYDARIRSLGMSANGNAPINPANKNYERYIQAAQEIGATPCP